VRAVVAWRLAKACYDLGRTDEMLTALAPELDADAPFERYPQGLGAVELLARRWWDERGYGHPSIEKLWTAYVAAQEDHGDPWLAACGRAQLAWSWACEGQREALWKLLVHTGGLGPRDFGRGPTRHPRADDASTSVFFAQMDVARIALRAAEWLGDEAMAREAYEVYADALAEADEPADYWFVAEALDHPRAPLHRALAAAQVNGDATELVARLSMADAAGPEWGIDARLLLDGLDGDPRWRREARGRVARFGVHVFDERVKE